MTCEDTTVELDRVGSLAGWTPPTGAAPRPFGHTRVFRTEDRRMRSPRDLLLQLSLEHRDLTTASRQLRDRVAGGAQDAVRDAAARIVEHELAHRLLVHPLLRRDGWGCRLFEERREEQLLLADRIQHALIVAGIIASPPVDEHDDLQVVIDPVDVVAGLDDQLVEHTDREEILAFPHLRHLASAAELETLGMVRHRLAGILRPQLAAAASPVADGGWATVARRDLPGLLELPDDLVAELPAPTPTREPVVS